MKRSIVLAAALAALPGLAVAHATILPRESSAASSAQQLAEQPAQQSGVAAVIEKWLAAYDAAFNAKDLEKLGTFYHPDVTVFEGGGIDSGWAAYRDHHLGPELKQFENLQFAHSDVKVVPLDGGAAYVTALYSLKAQMGERAIDSGGLATYVLVKGSDGAWKIRHSHTSSRPRRPQQ